MLEIHMYKFNISHLELPPHFGKQKMNTICAPLKICDTVTAL